MSGIVTVVRVYLVLHKRNFLITFNRIISGLYGLSRGS